MQPSAWPGAGASGSDGATYLNLLTQAAGWLAGRPSLPQHEPWLTAAAGRRPPPPDTAPTTPPDHGAQEKDGEGAEEVDDDGAQEEEEEDGAEDDDILTDCDSAEVGC